MMKRFAHELCRATIVLGFSASVFGTGAARAEMAKVYTAGPMKIAMPWMRATPKGVEVAVGYLTITNTGSESDRLTGGSTAIAAQLSVHEMSTSGGVMKMRELDQGLEIRPGETVELKPNGYHLMMTGLKQQIKKGDHIKATLTFEKAGPVDVEFEAGGIGGGMPGMSGM